MTDYYLVETLIKHAVTPGNFDADKTMLKLAEIINRTLDNLPVGKCDVNYLKENIKFHLDR